MPDQSLSERWRQAALEPYTDEPTTTDEWLRALELGADAAVRVVLEHLIDRAKTHGDSGAVEAMYALEVELSRDPPYPLTNTVEQEERASWADREPDDDTMSP